MYWDDLHVLHKKGRLLEENHYYPHGLTIRSGISSPLPTRQGYQGKELQDEVGMELYDFHARQYDPQVGRFWGVDPMNQFPSGYTGMGNDPANLIDPTGMASYGGGGGGLTYDPYSSRPVFQGATFEGLRNPFENQSYYDDVMQTTAGSGSTDEIPQTSTEVPATETCQGDDIIVNGTDGKTVRVIAPGDDKTLNVPAALGTSQTIDAGAPTGEGTNIVYGYTFQGDVQGAMGAGEQAGAEISVASFTTGDFSNYNYTYAGVHTAGSGGIQGGVGASAGVSIFVGWSTAEDTGPRSFAGATGSFSLAGSAKLGAGAGFSISGWASGGSLSTPGWRGISIGVNVGIGPYASLAAAGGQVSYTKLLNNITPTAQRSYGDRIFNRLAPIGSGVTQAAFKTIKK